VASALACFEREVSDRAEPKVKASREAAAFFHSPAACDPSGYGIEGVSAELRPRLLEAMREHGVGAGLGGGLEAAVRAIHAELAAQAEEAAVA
jgi:hypothetical protein